MGCFESRKNSIANKLLKHLIGTVPSYIYNIFRAAAMDGFKEMAEVSPAVFAEICTPKYVIGEFADTNMPLVG